jgi:nucleotide-binding universal stress UspA family protein
MIKIDRILFPVDLSEQSRQAVPFVTAMAARFNSKLIVLHVLPPRLSYYPLLLSSYFRSLPLNLRPTKASRAFRRLTAPMLDRKLFQPTCFTESKRDSQQPCEHCDRFAGQFPGA